MHPPHSLTFGLLLAGIAAGLSSCSTAKKREIESEGGLLGRLSIDGVGQQEERETYAELKAIANDPSSKLPSQRSELEEADDELITSATAPADPSSAWKRKGVEPRRISIGDIFSENIGPILNKRVSLADALPAEGRERLIDQISTEREVRVPMTLSQDEITALREEANPAAPFPTRSVALDFKTRTRTADEAMLERLFASAEAGEAPDGIDKANAKSGMSDVKKRLQTGERLFTIVAVTESDKLEATYPGAPLGSRDAEPIRNAVGLLYPHLDSLEAQKEGEAVVITRDHGIYWEFDARELKLEEGKIVIDGEAVANL